MKTRRFQAARILAAAFFLPALVLLVVYAMAGMTPFGEKSLLIMDMSSQYVEFYAGLRHLGQDASLLFSWSKAMGQNYVGLFAYYVASPFSFITLLFPEEWLLEALMFINLLKVGCAGLCFCVLLRTRLGKWKDSFAFFSLMYALMSYNVVYSLSLMWLDGVIWLPLVVVGVDRIVQKGRPWLLMVSFAVLFISNYYIGYMVFVFAVLYFLWENVSRWPGWACFFKRLGLCAFASVMAAGLSAWLTCPTFFSLTQGKFNRSFFSFSELVEADWKQIAGKSFLGYYDSITYDGMPSLFCGCGVGILSLSYFLNRKIKPRERLASLGVLAILFVSFMLRPVDLFWHGGQSPVWFPYRFAFVFGFFMVFLAARSYAMGETQGRLVAAGYIWLALMATAYAFFTGGDVRNVLMIGTLISGFAYLGCLMLISGKRVRAGAVVALLLALGCAESGYNASQMVNGLDKQFTYKTAASFYDFRARVKPLVERAKEEEAGAFFRMEKDFQRSQNDPMGLGYNGLTHYSSTYNQSVNQTLKALGFAQSYIWSTGDGSTPVTDALFGIEYWICEGETCAWYDAVDQNDGATLYRNPGALSLVYPADETVLDLTLKGQSLWNHQLLLSAVTGDQEACLVAAQVSQTYADVSPTDSKKHLVTYSCTVQADGPVYARFPKKVSTSSLYVDGEFRKRYFTNQTYCNFYVGEYAKGDVVEISLCDGDWIFNAGTPEVYTIDDSVLWKQLSALRKQQMAISDYSASRVRGTVDAREDTLMFTTIPYDTGWRVLVDGERVEVLTALDTFLCFRVPEGRHAVELTYEPAGFRLGVIITAVTAIGLLLGLAFYNTVWRKRKPRQEARPERENLGAKAWVSPQPVLIVGTYDENDAADVTNAAWGNRYADNQIMLCLNAQKAADNIRLKGAFTVSMATSSQLAASDSVGVLSGDDASDRLTKAGWTVTKSGFVDAPIINELPLTLECALVRFDEDGHVIGEIVNVSADKGILNEVGNVDMAKLDAIFFDPMSAAYLKLGQKVGDASRSDEALN